MKFWLYIVMRVDCTCVKFHIDISGFDVARDVVR